MQRRDVATLPHPSHGTSRHTKNTNRHTPAHTRTRTHTHIHNRYMYKSIYIFVLAMYLYMCILFHVFFCAAALRESVRTRQVTAGPLPTGLRTAGQPSSAAYGQAAACMPHTFPDAHGLGTAGHGPLLAHGRTAAAKQRRLRTLLSFGYWQDRAERMRRPWAWHGRSRTAAARPGRCSQAAPPTGKLQRMCTLRLGMGRIPPGACAFPDAHGFDLGSARRGAGGAPTVKKNGVKKTPRRIARSIDGGLRGVLRGVLRGEFREDRAAVAEPLIDGLRNKNPPKKTREKNKKKLLHGGLRNTPTEDCAMRRRRIAQCDVGVLKMS